MSEEQAKEAIEALRRDREARVEALRNSFRDLGSAIEGKVEEKVVNRTKTYFFSNNKRTLKTVGVVALGVTFQLMRKKLKKQEGQITLLTLENQFMHFAITGLTSPDTNPSEFNKAIAERAEFVKIVSQL